jgi:mRNA-degrading endonuclease RelE of RelBE toxin-antitoxin system
MTFTVVWRPEPVAALRSLRREDPAAAKALLAVVGALAKDPRPLSSKPLGSGRFRRLKLEDLRVLYEIDDDSVAVFVVKVGSVRR